MATLRGDFQTRTAAALWIAGIVLAVALPARGQIYFGISPIRAEHQIKPGDSLTDVFNIRNNAPGPIRIRVYVENWTLQPDGTATFIGSAPTTYSCKDWIIVNPQDFRLGPGETRTVRYTMTAPPETVPGGYHASVSFETVPDVPKGKAASRMLFTGKIAAAVYVVAGAPAIEGDLVDMTIGTKNNAQAVILALANTGRTHYRTKGKIQVFDASGKKVLDFILPDDVVLPESRKNVACALPSPLAPGSYRVVCTLDIGRPELMEMERTLEVVK